MMPAFYVMCRWYLGGMCVVAVVVVCVSVCVVCGVPAGLLVFPMTASF